MRCRGAWRRVGALTWAVPMPCLHAQAAGQYAWPHSSQLQAVQGRPVKDPLQQWCCTSTALKTQTSTEAGVAARHLSWVAVAAAHRTPQDAQCACGKRSQCMQLETEQTHLDRLTWTAGTKLLTRGCADRAGSAQVQHRRRMR